MTKTKEVEKIEKQKEDNNKKSKLSKALNIISYCLLIPIFLMFLSMIGSILITRHTIGVPMVYNYSLLTICSGSMENSGFDIGERVFIKKTNPKNYKTGDIIAFYDYVDPFCLNPYQVTDNNKPNKKPKRTRIVFHEIINVLKDSDGKNWYVTKGSNNINQDRNIIYENYVIGEYQPLSEKGLDVLNFIFSIKGALIFVVLPCTIIVFVDCYTLTGLFMELSAQKKNGKTDEEENLTDNAKSKKDKNKPKENNVETNEDDNLENKNSKKKSQEKQNSKDVDSKNKDKNKDKDKTSNKEESNSLDNKKVSDKKPESKNTKEKSQKEENTNKTKEKSDASKKTIKTTSSSKDNVKKDDKKQPSTKSESSKKKSSK